MTTRSGIPTDELVTAPTLREAAQAVVNLFRFDIESDCDCEVCIALRAVDNTLASEDPAGATDKSHAEPGATHDSDL